MNEKERYNEALKKLYTSQWEQLKQALTAYNSECGYSECKTYPYLLKAGEHNGRTNYVDAQLKIMIFGQEAGVWGEDSYEGLTIDRLQEHYQNSWLGNPYNKRIRSKLSNFIKDLFDSIHGAGFMQNNVLKISVNGKNDKKKTFLKPTAALIKIIGELFNVIPQEIELFAPDVLLFLSGPHYDGHIENHIGKYEVEEIAGFDAMALCKLHFEDAPMKGKLALRTYHPGHFRGRYKALGETVLKKIKEIVIFAPD